MIANRYEVRGSLGAGAGGAVFRVIDHTEGDEVALKIVDPNSVTPLGVWAEAQILRRLSDHHILPIRNAFTHLGVAMVVTEIARGGTVQDRIALEPCGIDPKEAVRWTRQACQGISRAHDLGLVHNDIKPGNLFLTATSDCRVGDFGFAGLMDPATGLASVYGGTFSTLAPEVAVTWSTKPEGTAFSDVYSLAASAFWMLAGAPPHDLSGCADDSAKTAHIASVRARKLRDVAPHVPDAISRVVDRALSLNPADRPASAHQLSADLGRTISGRLWRRTDEHAGAGHFGCWRGTPTGNGSVYVMCMTADASGNQAIFTTTHLSSSARINRGCGTATKKNWPAAVRRLMRTLG